MGWQVGTMILNELAQFRWVESDVMPKVNTGDLTTAGHVTDPAFGDAPAFGCLFYI